MTDMKHLELSLVLSEVLAVHSFNHVTIIY